MLRYRTKEIVDRIFVLRSKLYINMYTNKSYFIHTQSGLSFAILRHPLKNVPVTRFNL